jgi:flavodoxin
MAAERIFEVNSLVVYFSKFGNTKDVAEQIGKRLGEAGPVQVVNAEQLNADDLAGVDLMVMGCPTHKMRLPVDLEPVLSALPKRALHGAPVAAFDTSYKMSAFLSNFTASKRLVGRLRKLGGKPVVPPETFLVMERQGPLYEGELERAGAWAGKILERAQARSKAAVTG